MDKAKNETQNPDGDPSDKDSIESDDSYYSGLDEESTTDEDSNMATESSEEDGVDNLENDADKSLSFNESLNTKDQLESSSIRLSTISEENDTSDEEEVRNTVGNIPLQWYSEFPHIGYSLDGKKIIKPEKGDELDSYLSAMDDPDFWRTVRNQTNTGNIKLSDEDLEIIKNIQSGYYADNQMDPYEPYVDWFTGEKMIHPIKDTPETKRSFIPSKWEHEKIIKLVRSIRNGWIKPKPVKDEKNRFYLLWNNDDEARKDHPMHWPAPKLKPPGHAESYNPPSEYLLDKEEEEQWKETDPEDREKNYIPIKYKNLRSVPAYSKFIEERFERCLDLYLCPRQRKIRLQVDPADLIPKLPKPSDLQPFPSHETLVYTGHNGIVNSISVDPSGQWLASGSEDKTVCFWEISTCRCLKKLVFKESVNFVDWNPNSTLCLVAISVGNELVIVNPGLGDKLLCTNTDNSLFGLHDVEGNEECKDITWKNPTNSEKGQGHRMHIMHDKLLKQGSWHSKGDYFAAVLSDGGKRSLVIHQISKRKSQIPFKKTGGLLQCVKFHPTKPFIFIATQRSVRIYNLQKQELIKKLVSGLKWISSIDIHPLGDNLIIGSYDKRLCWFDIDLSAKPYKTLRHHKKAIQDVKFHKSYPLFASTSDDGSVIIFHGRVFSDLMQNPMIVPVKIIRCHKTVGDSGVTCCVFHPSQPWIFTAGADKTIKLCT